MPGRNATGHHRSSTGLDASEVGGRRSICEIFPARL